METNHALSILSAEPVVELLLRVEWRADGLSLWWRHRHYAGLFTDCEDCTCTRLTHGELYDVLTCLVDEVGPTGQSRLSLPF